MQGSLGCPKRPSARFTYSPDARSHPRGRLGRQRARDGQPYVAASPFRRDRVALRSKLAVGGIEPLLVEEKGPTRFIEVDHAHGVIVRVGASHEPAWHQAHEL